MVKFIIIRHGYSEGNREKCFSGQLDVGLDRSGIIQAKETAKYITDNFKVDSIYSSDLSRALETVRPIAEALSLEIVTKEDLREVDVGIWQGRTIEDVKKEYPDEFQFYKENPGLHHFEGGESYEILMKRALNALKSIAEDNNGKTVVIGTHGGVIRTIRAGLTNTPLEKIKDIPHVPNGSITVIDYENGTADFKMIGYSEFLSENVTEEGVK